MSRKLHLGCRKDIKEGWINIDIFDFGQEMVRDITKGLPFDDDSVDEIYTCHCLEHIAGMDVYFVLEECWRVLKKGCQITIRVPHSSEQEAFYPGHRSYWNEKVVSAMVFDYFEKERVFESYKQGKYQWKIIENEKHGNELFVKLEKI